MAILFSPTGVVQFHISNACVMARAVDFDACVSLRPYGALAGLYRLEDGDCVVEPPRYPWHFPTPYMAADWGDVMELRIYAPETPEVSGGEVTKLAEVGPFAVYLGTTRRRRYEVRCCGKTRGFRSPPAAASPPVTAMYEVLPDRAADRLGCRDLRRDFCGGTLKDVAALAAPLSTFQTAFIYTPCIPP